MAELFSRLRFIAGGDDEVDPFLGPDGPVAEAPEVDRIGSARLSSVADDQSEESIDALTSPGSQKRGFAAVFNHQCWLGLRLTLKGWTPFC